MTYIVLFEDNPTADPEIRQTHMKAHLSFLGDHAGQVLAAGPLHDDLGASAGGLWIVQGKNAAAVERLVLQDPFWPTGLRASYRILQWTQVFGNLGSEI
ncbi:MAG: hypothetical protein COB16_06120 [Rhodobacteraceae bacterium]|nr:MAG: hypothetical protein COB16_06120 [Paracoccaceae bacterium]